MSLPVLESPSTLLQVGGAFTHEQEPPASWVQRLLEISPPSEAVGQLLLVWEPGEEVQPGQRWALYECVTPEWANPVVLAELRGPHPRSEGHMCSTNVPKQFQCLCRRKWEAWRGGPCSEITLTQWKLYQKTGLVGRPFWILQGQQGGHKAFFTKQEQVMLGDAGLPSEPPMLGTLSYAPFDERVVNQIMRFNRLQQFAGDLRRYRKAMGPEHAQYVAEQDRQMRMQIVQMLGSAFAPEEDVYRSAVGNDDITDLMPRSEFDIDAVADDVEETFIETGRAPDPETLYRLKYGQL